MISLAAIMRVVIVVGLIAITHVHSALLHGETRPTQTSTHASAKIVEFAWPAFDLPADAKQDIALLPRRVQELNGRRIRVTGYMMPTFRREDISQFVLLGFRDMKFGVRRSPQTVMIVKMEGAKTVSYATDALVLEGTLVVDDWLLSKDGEVVCVYRLTAVTCEPAAGTR